MLAQINFFERYHDMSVLVTIGIYLQNKGCFTAGKITSQKTHMRRVDMAKALINSLTNYRKVHPEIRDNDLILTSEHGEYCATKDFYKRWDEYILDLSENAGLKEYFTSKQLRHYFASLCYMSGIDVKSTSKLMGHSSPDITLRIYVHLDNKIKRVKLTKLDEYIA